jgi:hypothetical protein
MAGLRGRVAGGRWDAVLDFTGNDRSALLSVVSGARRRVCGEKFAGTWWRRRAWNERSGASVRELHTIDFHQALVRELVPWAEPVGDAGHLAMPEEGVRGLLGSKVPGAVRVAMMVAGEKRMGGLKAEVEGALGRFPADRDLFRTGVAALEMMGLAEGAKPEGQIDGFLVRMVGQRDLPAAVRGLAMVSLGNREAASRVLLEVLSEKDDAVAALAARALGGGGP